LECHSNTFPSLRLVCRTWKQAVDNVYLNDLKIKKLQDIITQKQDNRAHMEGLNASISASKKEIAITAGMVSAPATLAVSALMSAAGALTLNPVLFFGGLIAPACSAASTVYEPLNIVPALPVAVPVYCLTHVMDLVPLPDGGEKEQKQLESVIEEIQVETDMTCSIIKESVALEDQQDEETFIASVEKSETYHGITYFHVNVVHTRLGEDSTERYEILKRYNDFHELHELLCRQYPHIMSAVTYFPTKRYWNTQSVIEERLIAFDKYVQFLLTNETLRNDPDVIQFFKD
jgi:hypothetical protein